LLHVGGIGVSAADYYPKKTIKTNTTAAQNIVDAVKAQPNPDAVKVVYIAPLPKPATAIHQFTGQEPATR
jgi:inosine-uridine nucleoside N-ribohydrolase